MTQMEEAEEEAQQEPTHQWNPFESLVIQKMDAILHLHQEHQVDVHSSLENITTSDATLPLKGIGYKTLSRLGQRCKRRS